MSQTHYGRMTRGIAFADPDYPTLFRRYCLALKRKNGYLILPAGTRS